MLGECGMPSERDSFVRHESASYLRAYREVQEEDTAYCTANGIDLVLNDNSPRSVANPDSPELVTSYLRRDLLYTGPGCDITPEILRRIRERDAKQKKPASEDASKARPTPAETVFKRRWTDRGSRGWARMGKAVRQESFRSVGPACRVGLKCAISSINRNAPQAVYAQQAFPAEGTCGTVLHPRW